MTIDLQPYLEKGRRLFHKLDARFYMALRGFACILGGFFLSAASLGGLFMPIAMAFTFACTGGNALLWGIGACIGYPVFWGQMGYQGVAWVAVATVYSLIPGGRRTLQRTGMLLPTVAGLTVAACGVVFQNIGLDTAGVPVYLLRVGLGAGTSVLFAMTVQLRHPILKWLTGGFFVLALAQIMPIPYLGLGYVAMAMLASAGSFPACALAGLALDLAQVTPIPMTGVAVLAYTVRLLPLRSKWLPRIAPAVTCLVMMCVCRAWDLYPLPGLAIGGVAGILLPGAGGIPRRRGEVGAVQVQLELASGVLAQTQQILLEMQTPPVDTDALTNRAVQRACGSCPCRKSCQDEKQMALLPGTLLHLPLADPGELPIRCRKSGRILAELRRSQEQLRAICSDRERQQEYRAALIQQYRFLTEFLQDLADRLPRRTEGIKPIYEPDVHTFGNRPEAYNGDRSLAFAGVGCKYYVLLCDGMGTGMGAVREGSEAATMLKRMLVAGYPAEHALRSLNSLCALRDRAGVVAVDLLETDLSTGKGVLYKWGAAPSYMVTEAGGERIGTVTPPPGLSVTDAQEASYPVSLRRAEMLVLVSDGVPDALQICRSTRSPRELANRLLNIGRPQQDDATVVTVRLRKKQNT